MGAKLDWPGGSATLEPLGGMLAPLRLSLPDGRLVEPLAIAPWAGETLPEAPPILRGLRGDFACLPFGTGEEGLLAPRWAAVPHATVDPPHGPAANSLWKVWVERGVLRGRFAPAINDPIALVERDVRPDGPSGILCKLVVTARRECQLPIALHPIFQLSKRLKGTRVELHEHGPIFTHPSLSVADPCPLRPDSMAERLEDLPGREGTTIDLHRLPISEPSESRVLVTHSGGRVSLHHAEGWAAHLTWDAEIMPSVMLWISNRGRSGPPWRGRHVALGIEPCAAAFDLGTAASAEENPLTALGLRTSVFFKAGQPIVIRYSISVSAD